MELLPMEADILPPSDDRVFKLILTPKESKPILIDLISSILNRPVVDVVVRNSEIPPEDTQEKAEKLDVNCMIDDGSQVDLDYSDFRFIPINLFKERICRMSKQVYRNNYFNSHVQVCR